MNNPSPANTQASTIPGEPTAIADAGTVEQRVSGLFEELGREPVRPAVEDADDATSPPAGTAPATTSAADSTDEARRAERRARLDALKATERQSVDRKERQSANDKLQRDFAAAQARAEQAEARAAAGIDRSILKDPLKVIKLLEDAGIPADQVANAIRESITNPEITATRAAREAISPELAAMRQAMEAQQAQIADLLAQQSAASAHATEQRDTEDFLGFAGAAKDTHKLSASLLAHDRNEFLALANIAAAGVPAGAGRAALLDRLEDMLDGDVRQVAQKYAAIYGPTPAPSPATQPRSGAVQPTTVSNSLAQGRSTLVEEEDFARLPIEERAKRLIRSM